MGLRGVLKVFVSQLYNHQRVEEKHIPARDAEVLNIMVGGCV